MHKIWIVVLACCSWSAALAGAYSDAGPSVVQIHIEGTLKILPDGAKSKFYADDATGFVASPDGMVMTAGHVVPSADDFEPDTLSIEGRFPSEVAFGGLQANDPAVTLRIVKSSRTPHDIGLFKIDNPKKPLKFLRLCDEVSVEQDLTFLGYLGGLRDLTSRKAYVSGVGADPSPLKIQVPMTKGDSGGPLINSGGGVVAVGIGQLHINHDRVETINLAVWMHHAISAMSPEAKALVGISYDPACGKQLSNPVPPDLNVIQLDRATGVFVNSGQMKTITQSFNAPEGKIFSEIVGTSANTFNDTISVLPSTTAITGNGKTLNLDVQVTGKLIPKSTLETVLETFGFQQAMKVASASVNGKILAKVQNAPNDAVVASARPDTQLRSFLISRTLDVQGATTTRQSFNDRIDAPAGYRFASVMPVNVVSSSHVSSALEASVTEDGTAIRATYSLESGATETPWKAWIDAFVTAALVPKDK